MKTTPMGTTATVERTHSRDPYARIAELDETVVAMLAERLEKRGRQKDQQRLWREVLSRATYADGSRVLEVGCGTGIVTEKIADRPGVTSVVGVDPSPYLIDRARQRAPSLRFDVADGRALPFADESFDGVVMATVLCHIPGPEQALAEAHRVLKPDGSLLIYDGDYATTTVAISPHDPLQTCVATSLAQLVHDPWLIRRLLPLVQAAEFQPGRLHSHGYVETVSPAYLFTIVDFGADALAAQGEISPTTAEALKDEARDRARSGRFFGHIAYASLLATRRQ